MLGDFEKSALRQFSDFNCGNVRRIRSEKVQKIILWAKNSVWRRLRRARAKNTLKTRFWKVIFGQNPPTKIIFVCWAKTLKNHCSNPSPGKGRSPVEGSWWGDGRESPERRPALGGHGADVARVLVPPVHLPPGTLHWNGTCKNFLPDSKLNIF